MYDVITIGTATRDAFFDGFGHQLVQGKRFRTGRGLCLALGAKIEVPRVTFTTGGGATNAAVTFARQGLKTGCIARVGNDVSGEEVKRSLRREGADSRFIAVSKKSPTAYSVLLLTPGGERTVLVHRGASDELTARDVPWPRIRTRWLYVFPGNAVGLSERVLPLAKKRGIRVALNPSATMLDRGTTYFKKILCFVDVLILNREEGSRITGVPYPDAQGIFKRIDALAPCLVALTDGPRGVMVSDGVNFYMSGTYRERKLVDRTGAGDAFGSGFVAGLIQKVSSFKFSFDKLRIPSGAEGQVSRRREGCAVCDFYPPEIVEYAIRLGSANATSVVEHIGAKAGILTKREFERNSRWQKLVITRKKLT